MAVISGQGKPGDVLLTKQRALEIARKTLADLKSENELVIQDEKTVEHEFGWVFYTTSRDYLRTKDPRDLVPGIGPLVVDRLDGSARFLATSVPPEEAVEEYRRRWRESKQAQ